MSFLYLLDFNAFITLLGSLSSCYSVLSVVNNFGLNISTFNLIVIRYVLEAGIGKSIHKSQEVGSFKLPL